jgi:hypothetical protein
LKGGRKKWATGWSSPWIEIENGTQEMGDRLVETVD